MSAMFLYQLAELTTPATTLLLVVVVARLQMLKEKLLALY
jgi:hypothetical protein